MTTGKETMGEQPIFTCKAHVFHIDPKTKRSWMSASTTAVSVSFFYDSSRDLYRIISVEGSKAVINSTITGNMTFTKTSQKFGQWSDVRANTVYGLGFASEQELGKFIEKFQEVKEAIQARGGGADKLNNGSSAVTPVASAAASPLLAARAAAEDSPSIPQIKQEIDDMPGHQRAHSNSSSVQGGYATVGRSPRAPAAAAPPDPISGDTEMQLRYENDRLKLALAQSSANAKKWEVELATLKSNNLRLTAALQESTANVDEWKRQLHQYREEVARARNMAGKGGEASEVEQLRVRLSQLEAELAHKDEELAQLNKTRRSEQDAEAKLAQSQLDLAMAAHDGQRQVLQALNDQLSRQIDELQVFGEWAQVEVVELVNDGSGLAFGIVGGRSSGVIIKSVLPGGVADRDGRLRPGDMLLRIGSVSTVGMCGGQAAAVLRQCGLCVRLLVARPASPNTQRTSSSSAPIVSSRLLAEPGELERRLAEAGHEGYGVLCDDAPASAPTFIEERHLMRPVASIVAVVPRGALSTPPKPPSAIAVSSPENTAPTVLKLPLDMAVRGPKEPETMLYEVELTKDSAVGLGITVAGYVCEQEEVSGIFVKSISEGSSAHLSGQMQVNDRIIEVDGIWYVKRICRLLYFLSMSLKVDGIDLHGVTNHKAVALLRDAKGPTVKLKALRYLRGAGFEKLQRALAAQDGRPLVAPPSPSVTSLAKYSFSVYEESTVIETEIESEAHHLPSPTSPSSELEIVIGVDDDEATRAQARRIQDKWRDILDQDPDWPGYPGGYDIIAGTIIKQKSMGVGISLEGTVRVVGGKEVQARHYIRAIAPDGALAKLDTFKVGDELLEVNGKRVLGAHHVEVVSRLRAVTSPVTLVCARARRDEPRRSVLSRNEMGGSLRELLPPPTRLIKAKSESSMTSACSGSTVRSGLGHHEFCPEALERNRSRSLEPLSGLAMWSDRVEYIDLVKEDRGLGFSILDYLNPSEPGGSVIVVRSVVAGGAAARGGRLAPGDRLLSVNGRDVSKAPLAVAVAAVKQAPKGIVRIGVAKPLPCSVVVDGQKVEGQNVGSQDCINSLASDDHTGLDSYHECLQEYGEGLEVVQICLEPEDPSIRDEIASVFSLEEDQVKLETIKVEKMHLEAISVEKSNEFLNDLDDELTITEEIIQTPRELPETRAKSNNSIFDEAKTLQQQSKEISTSDEMVFAVTPTGLERITFDRYWKDGKTSKNCQKETSKSVCENKTASGDTSSYSDAIAKTVEENCNLLFIDHDIDGYETCIDEESNSTKINEKIERVDRKIYNETSIGAVCKQTIDTPNNRVPSAKSLKTIQSSTKDGDVDTSRHPYVHEHIIKQMKSLRIEPLNFKLKPTKSPSMKKHSKVKCIEYYNDQAECLEEYNKQRKQQEEEILRDESKKRYDANLALMEKKIKLNKQELSEESTDFESTYVPGCHKCFLENYAFEIKQAYKEAGNCKYCAVIKDMLETTKLLTDRRLSAPALVSVDSVTTDTEDEDYLGVPSTSVRRTSAGPLRFTAPVRRSSHVPKMTVTVSPDRRSDALVAQRWGAPRRVTLTRDPGSALGVSIVGGKVDIVSSTDSEDGDEKTIFGIFIKNVVADSPAGRSGELSTGDRILEVDGLCVRTASHERVVQLIKSAGDTVTLTVQSLLAWQPTDSSDLDAPSTVRKESSTEEGSPQHEIKITVTAEPDTERESSEVDVPKPAYSDTESSDDEEDERELGGRVYSEQGVEIDRASAGAIKRSKDEKDADPEKEDEFGYTTNKIRKKYAALGESVVMVKLERSMKAGLGLSLAGHRDRTKMAVFVCGMNPAGAAAKAKPTVKIGDEILEVNGIVLHGRCHLNASAIIKGMAGPVFKFILLRRKQALEDVAVKPVTQFPMALDEDSEDRYSGYKGVKDVSIKKGTSSLGIMIIEGRHAEVGQGIFISDIQEGSAAEQAGLQIGDMILAVNKDSLLGCSYDTAAATLKRTEGVVVLTVCNPNKKDDSPTEDTATGGLVGTGSKPASRNQTPDPGATLKPGASRPQTPKPPASPAKVEPPPDPATAIIQPNKETVIEINTNNKSLGVMILAGSDSAVNGPAAVLLEVYPKGAAAQDGRLKPGDQIVECSGTAITKDMTYERVCLTIKRLAPKMKMTVFRPDPIPYTEITAELVRKPGKGLGLVLMAKSPPPGCFISDLLPGGSADLDGRLKKGDLLMSVDGKDVSTSDHETVAVACKTVGPKAVIKVKRFKIVR